MTTSTLSQPQPPRTQSRAFQVVQACACGFTTTAPVERCPMCQQSLVETVQDLTSNLGSR